MKGYNTIPQWLRKAYIKAVKGECQDCGSTKDLQVHRIKQGYKGGLYTPNNCKVLCKECHKRYNEIW